MSYGVRDLIPGDYHQHWEGDCFQFVEAESRIVGGLLSYQLTCAEAVWKCAGCLLLLWTG
jgi:hypothetical protein